MGIDKANPHDMPEKQKAARGLAFPHASRSPIRSVGLNRSWARAAFSASEVAEYRRTIVGVLCLNRYRTGTVAFT